MKPIFLLLGVVIVVEEGMAMACGREKVVGTLNKELMVQCKSCVGNFTHLFVLTPSPECVPCSKFPHESPKMVGLHFVAHEEYCDCPFILAKYQSDHVGCDKGKLPVQLYYDVQRDGCLDPELFIRTWRPDVSNEKEADEIKDTEKVGDAVKAEKVVDPKTVPESRETFTELFPQETSTEPMLVTMQILHSNTVVEMNETVKDDGIIASSTPLDLMTTTDPLPREEESKNGSTWGIFTSPDLNAGQTDELKHGNFNEQRHSWGTMVGVGVVIGAGTTVVLGWLMMLIRGKVGRSFGTW